MFRRIFALFLLVAVNQCAAADDASIVWPAAFSSSFKKAWGEYALQVSNSYERITGIYESTHSLGTIPLVVLSNMARTQSKRAGVNVEFWILVVCHAKALAEAADADPSCEKYDMLATTIANIAMPFWDCIRTISDQDSAKLLAAALWEIAASFGFHQPQPGAVIGESDVIFPRPFARVERWQAIAQARWPSDVVDILRRMRLEKDAEELAEGVDRMSLASGASKRSRRG